MRQARLRREWIATAGLIVAIAVAVVVVPRLVRDPELIASDLPIHLPRAPSAAELGERIPLGPLSFTVSGYSWIDSRAFGAADRLSARADPRAGRDYLVLEVTLANRSDDEVDARYQGQGAPLDLRATARRPQPTLFSPVLTGDTRIITGREPLPSGPLAPGEEVGGPLVFALEPSRRQLGLLLVPTEAGLAPVEVALSDER